jgi:hypothetical protein
MIELTSKQKGNIAELECLLAINKYGFKTSIPFGDDCRYDLVVDINNKLYRIQCKKSRALQNSEGFKFNTKSIVITTHGVKESKYTKDEIDFFATVYDGQCYLVPVDECGKEKSLRFKYPSNGQKKHISLAVNYTLEEVAKRLA